MMKKYTFLLLWVLHIGPLSAQEIVWTEPYFPRPDQPVTIYFDATKGTAGLKDCGCTVYIHTGVITDKSTSNSDWKYVPTSWGVANAAWAMEPVAGQPNVYKYEISPSIRQYYQIPAEEMALKLAMVFRNATGSREGKDTGGKDIFYDIFNNPGLAMRLINPTAGATLVLSKGAVLPVEGVVSENAALSLWDNGTKLAESSGTRLTHLINAGEPGGHQVELRALTGSGTADTLRFQYVVPVTLARQDPPAGTQSGINMLPDGKIRLSLTAPGKGAIFVLGDFNDWALSTDYQMVTSLDGTLQWLDLPAPATGTPLRFQYLVDGKRRFGDPYSTLVLDPAEDRFITPATFPGLPAYPVGKTEGIVSVVAPELFAYDWQTTNFQAPAKEKLVVYELLMRDFLATHNYQTLLDTLDYLQALGVNTLELMPVNEFEGNLSWGYNPSYHMALDKYYGTPAQLKAVVDACHARGIAVVIDVVFNHAFSQSPLCQLFWDDANFRPSSNNPWLNPTARHEFNVGYDFNHESPQTKAWMKQVLKYWQQEFRIDGFRFDLSKGFTQKNTIGNVGLWGQYDASRVAIWKDYADAIWATDPDAYVILEHFADNNEETELVNYGMMVWGNMNGTFSNAAKGTSNSLNGLDYRNRGWTKPGQISYMESHDEERLMYLALKEGLSNASYNIRSLPTALERIEFLSMFFYLTPGPKMLWQFGELGYDFSIKTCEDGVVRDCRLSPKPIRWDYLQNSNRERLFRVTQALMDLRNTYDVFHTTDFTVDLGSTARKQLTLRHSDFQVVALANAGLVASAAIYTFPQTGTWYEYFTGDSVTVIATSQTLNLAAGEYRLYTSKRLPPPAGGYLVTNTREALLARHRLEISPNPAMGPQVIAYQLPESAEIQLSIVDNLGRVVNSWPAQRQVAGYYQLPMEENLPAGWYSLRMVVQGAVLTIPFVRQ